MEHNAPITFGFIEGGSLRLWQKMAALVEQSGGDVLTGAAAKAVTVENYQATGVHFRYQQRDHYIQAPIVVSNIGPAATASLVPSDSLEQSYLARLKQVTPTAIMWLHFSSPELLMEYSALAVGCSRRVNMIDVPSFEAEGVAPAGQHLYTVGGAPLNSLDPDDINIEFDALLEDLREIFPDFDRRTEVLTKTCYRGEWPGFRTVSGSRPGHRTPVLNLFNVGDGAGPPGFEGSMGAAKSALMVAEDVAQFP
jgi:phytoene dehydrogenase-like protein